MTRHPVTFCEYCGRLHGPGLTACEGCGAPALRTRTTPTMIAVEGSITPAAAKRLAAAWRAAHEKGGRMPKRCSYESCRQCGICGVCLDFHGDVYGGCVEGRCPSRWWNRLRDRVRRWLYGPFVPPWSVEP